MTTIRASVIADSVSPSGVRLTALKCRYPWIIHPELLTHRSFARNSSSMRAIPTRKLIEDVEADPYVPLEWTKAQRGMEPGDELDEVEREAAQTRWYHAMHDAIRHARQLSEIGLSKQHASRLLMPFAHINTVLTATDWDNFLDLRLAINPETGRPVAQVETYRLAQEIESALGHHAPVPLFEGDWHTPFAPPDLPVGQRIAVSAARCARVSYLTHDGREPSLEEDLALHRRLRDDRHLSPLEHQATPLPCNWKTRSTGPFRGWEQWRMRVEQN